MTLRESELLSRRRSFIRRSVSERCEFRTKFEMFRLLQPDPMSILVAHQPDQAKKINGRCFCWILISQWPSCFAPRWQKCISCIWNYPTKIIRWSPHTWTNLSPTVTSRCLPIHRVQPLAPLSIIITTPVFVNIFPSWLSSYLRAEISSSFNCSCCVLTYYSSLRDYSSFFY